MLNTFQALGGGKSGADHSLWLRGTEIAKASTSYTNTATELQFGAWNGNASDMKLCELIVWDGYPGYDNMQDIQKNQMDAFEIKYPGYDAAGGGSSYPVGPGLHGIEGGL
mgnify:CR=1 FL=1